MKKLLLLLLLLLLVPILSLSHPHVFIDTKLNFIVKKEKINKLNISWHFDDMNSQIFMMDYDLNRDKKLNKKEIQRFRKEYFSKLSKKKYFTHIKVDGKKIDISKQINNFSLDYKKSLFIVNFTLNFQKIKQTKSINIGFWDEENYNAFSIEEDSIKFVGKQLKINMDFFYADLFVADVFKIKL